MNPPEGIEYPGLVHLMGLSGSRMFGLAGPNSDEDWRGVWQAPTRSFVGVRPIPDKAWEKKPDVTLWELGHFCRLLLKGNPNIIEMLWMPQDCVAISMGYVMEQLHSIREQFLTQRMASAFLGWVHSERRAPNLTPKRAHHMPRLLWELVSALDGDFKVRWQEASRDVLLKMKSGELSVEATCSLVDVMLNRIERDPRIKKLPPDGPVDEVEQLLLDARRGYW